MRFTPEAGSKLVLHCGDLITFLLETGSDESGHAYLRTNLGQAHVRREEIVSAVELSRPILHCDWHDLPMRRKSDGVFELRVPLLEVGTFFAKSYFLPDHEKDPKWPSGENVRIKVEPASCAAGNTIYSAFVRQFGQTDPGVGKEAQSFSRLEKKGFTVIPPSGKFRDLIRHLDTIIGEMGCRIVQLLPVHPTPTTYAKMGSFGSPFAALDFMDVDPALAEFDRRTTPLDQFRELVDAVHRRHARIFMDIPVDHTGWASWLQIHHKEWFSRSQDLTFESPGAWGVTWGDLSKLDYEQRDLWRYIANVFLHWCRIGVDGFRCDAGYMVPKPAWEYITAKVRCEFPDTTFLLEGLGGPPELTESLLAEGGLNWAYSELFQNYTLEQIDNYLPLAIRSSNEAGLHIHFAETHDNDRLASNSKAFSLLRTALCALLSQEGGFGVTNGVEWFAVEKIKVHEANELNWGVEPNQVERLARLHNILENHPAYHPGAEIGLVHKNRSESLALRRVAHSGEILLVLANLALDCPNAVTWASADFPYAETFDLLSGRGHSATATSTGMEITLQPGEVLCLTPSANELGLIENLAYGFAPVERSLEQRMKALALNLWRHYTKDREPPSEPLELARKFVVDPEGTCASLAGRTHPQLTRVKLPEDLRRVVMVPPGHGVLVNGSGYFHAALNHETKTLFSGEAMPGDDGSWFLWLPPRHVNDDFEELKLSLRLHSQDATEETYGSLLFLPRNSQPEVRTYLPIVDVSQATHAILSNRLGAIAQVRGRWGEVESLYDAFLACNLDLQRPVDRRVMLTRMRGWIVWRDFSTELDHRVMSGFSALPGGAAAWDFDLPCGMGKRLRLRLSLILAPDRNAAKILIERPAGGGEEHELADCEEVRLILRPDIDDRINHGTTKAFMGPEQHWPGCLTFMQRGFVFSPARERTLKVLADRGVFTPEPEWTYNVEHTFENGRGLESRSDHYSPGFISVSLGSGESSVITAEVTTGREDCTSPCEELEIQPRTMASCQFYQALQSSLDAFVVRREDSATVIAGYPWFLDWGRDTLIFLRGLVAAGRGDDAYEIVRKFATFEDGGTLPNMLAGEDTTNRSTTDAPLWLIMVCADLLHSMGEKILDGACGERTLRQVLISIGEHYSTETKSGASMDPESGLVWSPTHHTWMDTNHPAGTPREGYPVEIQALWFAALGVLTRIDPQGEWHALSDKVRSAIGKYFTDFPEGFLSDCLHAPKGVAASRAKADDACRPNQLMAITFGVISDRRLCESILKECRSLLVPGAIRSLADRRVRYPLPINHDGRLLNDPENPYWGHYTGPENSRRKPAYHNGTAWAWPMPIFCEALYKVYGDEAREEALALLSSTVKVMEEGCLGHVPEVLDGDAPHTQRGCGAQAWSASENLRVWKLLTSDT